MRRGSNRLACPHRRALCRETRRLRTLTFVKAQLVVANPNTIAVVKLRGFDSLAVDEGALLHGEVFQRITRGASFDDGVTRLHTRVAEQPYSVFLGPPNHRGRTFEPELSAFEAAGLAHQPCGLGQLLYQPDKQADHESNQAESDQPRQKTGVAQRTDQVEAHSADEAANPSPGGALDDVLGRETRESNAHSEHEAHQCPSDEPPEEKIEHRTRLAYAPSTGAKDRGESQIGIIVLRDRKNRADDETDKKVTLQGARQFQGFAFRAQDRPPATPRKHPHRHEAANQRPRGFRPPHRMAVAGHFHRAPSDGAPST